MWTSSCSWRTARRARSRGRSTRWRMTSACASFGSRRTAAKAAPWRPERPAPRRGAPRPRRSSCSIPTASTTRSASRRSSTPPVTRMSSSATAATGARCRSPGEMGNRAASLALLATARTWVPDTQNGMRLFRTAALRDVPPPEGGYESESRHLRSLLGAGHRLASVEIPTIYDGEPSHFHPVRDTLRVARALAGRRAGSHRAPRGREAVRRTPARFFASGRRGWRLAARGDRARPGDARVPAARQRALPGRQRAWLTARTGSTRRSTRTRATTSSLLAVTVDRQRHRPAAAALRARRRARASCSARIWQARRSRW